MFWCLERLSIPGSEPEQDLITPTAGHHSLPSKSVQLFEEGGGATLIYSLSTFSLMKVHVVSNCYIQERKFAAAETVKTV